MQNRFFLRLGDDGLESALSFRTRRGAVNSYRATAHELWAYGQSLEATIHAAPDLESVAEYPDWVLSLGSRGGVRIERA